MSENQAVPEENQAPEEDQTENPLLQRLKKENFSSAAELLNAFLFAGEKYLELWQKLNEQPPNAEEIVAVIKDNNILENLSPENSQLLVDHVLAKTGVKLKSSTDGVANDVLVEESSDVAEATEPKDLPEAEISTAAIPKSESILTMDEEALQARLENIHGIGNHYKVAFAKKILDLREIENFPFESAADFLVIPHIGIKRANAIAGEFGLEEIDTEKSGDTQEDEASNETQLAEIIDDLKKVVKKENAERARVDKGRGNAERLKTLTHTRTTLVAAIKEQFGKNGRLSLEKIVEQQPPEVTQVVSDESEDSQTPEALTQTRRQLVDAISTHYKETGELHPEQIVEDQSNEEENTFDPDSFEERQNRADEARFRRREAQKKLLEEDLTSTAELMEVLQASDSIMLRSLNDQLVGPVYEPNRSLERSNASSLANRLRSSFNDHNASLLRQLIDEKFGPPEGIPPFVTPSTTPALESPSAAAEDWVDTVAARDPNPVEAQFELTPIDTSPTTSGEAQVSLELYEVIDNSGISEPQKSFLKRLLSKETLGIAAATTTGVLTTEVLRLMDRSAVTPLAIFAYVVMIAGKESLQQLEIMAASKRQAAGPNENPARGFLRNIRNTAYASLEAASRLGRGVVENKHSRWFFVGLAAGSLFHHVDAQASMSDSTEVPTELDQAQPPVAAETTQVQDANQEESVMDRLRAAERNRPQDVDNTSESFFRKAAAKMTVPESDSTVALEQTAPTQQTAEQPLTGATDNEVPNDLVEVEEQVDAAVKSEAWARQQEQASPQSTVQSMQERIAALSEPNTTQTQPQVLSMEDRVREAQQTVSEADAQSNQSPMYKPEAPPLPENSSPLSRVLKFFGLNQESSPTLPSPEQGVVSQEFFPIPEGSNLWNELLKFAQNIDGFGNEVNDVVNAAKNLTRLMNADLGLVYTDVPANSQFAHFVEGANLGGAPEGAVGWTLSPTMLEDFMKAVRFPETVTDDSIREILGRLANPPQTGLDVTMEERDQVLKYLQER